MKLTDENRLSIQRPELCSQWNYEKNGDLKPCDVSVGARLKVWWKCEKGHDTFVQIQYRTAGQRCPYCMNQKACKDNCLETLSPELAKEWNYDKNNGLLPSEVVSGSNKSVWWKCNCGNEWEARISTRYGQKQNCPNCYKLNGRYSGLGKKLFDGNKILMEEWDYTKNKNIDPKKLLCFLIKGHGGLENVDIHGMPKLKLGIEATDVHFVVARVLMITTVWQL